MPTLKIKAKKVSKKAVPKKPVVKVVAKKAISEKGVSRKSKEKVLVCAKDTECFWTTDGQILRDLTELQEALFNMDERVFLHHVQAGKNDFAEWVEHILIDAECAKELRKAKKISQAQKVVGKHLKTYTIS